MLLANFVGPYWEMIQAMGQWSLLSGALGVMCFALQIYFDFSGYSDMAIGLGRIFGFTLPGELPPSLPGSVGLRNSGGAGISPWGLVPGISLYSSGRQSPGRRAHHPQPGGGLAGHGLWHGAAVNFLLWGGYFGLLIIFERFVWGRALSGAPRALRHLYTPGGGGGGLGDLLLPDPGPDRRLPGRADRPGRPRRPDRLVCWTACG